MQDKPEKQVVASKHVGSMEEVFGEKDVMFMKEENLDLSDTEKEGENTVEEAEYEGEKIGFSDEPGENTVTENMKDNAPDEVPEVAPEDIKYLKNEETGHVFEVTPEIVGQRHLVPCTKEGKTFKDTRVTFNGMR